MSIATGYTELYGLLGMPVRHSFSPAMYNYAFEKSGINAVYLAFEAPKENLMDAVEALRTLHVKGFNVTMPDKVEVIKYLDEVTPAAQLIGAVNVVVPDEEGRLIGHNTDSVGFTDNLLSHDVKLKGTRVVLFGMGGAGTAVAVQLALEGVSEMHIFNRRDELFPNGERLVERLSKAVPSCQITYGDIADTNAVSEEILKADIVVNATRVGMQPHENETLVDRALLRPSLIVADTVYSPRETRLLREAREAGCRTFDGIGMLLYQGTAAFRLFTGREFPRKDIEEKFFS